MTKVLIVPANLFADVQPEDAKWLIPNKKRYNVIASDVEIGKNDFHVDAMER